MKIIFLLLFSLFFSCKDQNQPDLSEEVSHRKLHEEMDKVSEEFVKFDKLLENLYIESETKPERVIRKVDSLLIANQMKQININHKSNLIWQQAFIILRLNYYTR